MITTNGTYLWSFVTHTKVYSVTVFSKIFKPYTCTQGKGTALLLLFYISVTKINTTPTLYECETAPSLQLSGTHYLR